MRNKLLVSLPVALFAGLLAASAPASAASLTQVPSGWQVGTEPSWTSMYWYVPDGLPAGAPVIVLVHYCSGNAAGIFGEAQSGGIITQADQKKILLVVPQTSRNCWDVATANSLKHDAPNNDTKAIVDMTKYAIAQKQANANRVYIMGASSGAMVTQAMLAIYPDVFKAGAEFAGVPAGCWAVNNTTDGQWSSPCAGGQVTHTPQEWGDIARAMYPGYTGFRPRIQLWHGSADSIINYTNYTEAVDQWTNVLGLSATPTTTGTLSISNKSYNRRQWKDSCGTVVLDAFDEPGGPHGPDANMNGQYPLPFFGLDTTPFAAVDPQVAACGSTGTGGTTGAGGRGGTTGTAGAGGTTGAAGRGGTTGTAGTRGSAGRGGTTGSAGATGSAGTTGTGNTSGAAGTTGAAGDSGAAGTGVVSGTGGDSSGAAGDNGTSGQAGTSASGSGGDANPTGAAGTSGSAGTTGLGGSTMPGCACDVGQTSGAFNALMFAGLFAVIVGRRRAKRSAGK
jgi:poly(hydroxyalkanoate) depolymerase family esterase